MSLPQRGTSYRLSSQDAGFIYAESDSGPLHIGSIGLFEGRIDFESVVKHLEGRIHLVPRYRQRLTAVPFNLAHATMEDDPEFSMRNHAFLHELPPGLGENEALQQMMEVYQKPLDRKRPLWEVHIYPRLEGGRTAVMWKVHHCLVDGVSGVELLKVMYDFKPNPDPVPPPESPWTPQPLPGALERMARGARASLRSLFDVTAETSRELMAEPAETLETARMMARATQTMSELMLRRIAATPWNSAVVSQARTLGWSRHSFADFRAIRHAFGGSLNDVVLALLTEGAARYLKHHGYDPAGAPFCIGCPVNVRMKEEKSTLGNRVSMMFPTSPAEPMDVVERLHAISEETERIKSIGAAQAVEMLTRLGDAIPPALLGMSSAVATRTLDAMSALVGLSNWAPEPGAFGLPAFGINFIATNVPGVQVVQYLGGHRCLDMIPLVPLGATLGYNVAILSYNQNLYFGMSAEPRLMPDVALMTAFVDETFVELKQRSSESVGSAEPVMAAFGR